MRIINAIRQYSQDWDHHFETRLNHGTYSESELIGKIQSLISDGADVNELVPNDYQDPMGLGGIFPFAGTNPLWWAVKLRMPQVATFLIANGADVNAAPTIGAFAGANALWLAIEKDDVGNVPGDYGIDQDNYACDQNRQMLDLVQLLIAKGANVNAVCSLEGESVIRRAIKANRPQLIGLLIARGANDDNTLEPPCEKTLALAMIRDVFRVAILRDYFFDYLVGLAPNKAQKFLQNDPVWLMAGPRIRKILNHLCGLAAVANSTADQIRKNQAVIGAKLNYLGLVQPTTLPIAIKIRTAEYLVPQKMQSIFKVTAEEAGRLTAWLFKHIEDNINAVELQNSILQAQQDLMNLDAELQSKRKAYVPNKHKVAKVIFHNVRKSLGDDAAFTQDAFRLEFLPAFTHVVGKQKLSSFDLERRQKITQQAAQIFRPEGESRIPPVTNARVRKLLTI